jgi:hypothetical protein
MFSRQTFATSTALDPSIDVLAESENIFALPQSGRDEANLPGFVFVGKRQEHVPIRLVMFARPDDTVGSFALLKLLVDLELAPLLAHDYALFCYLSIPGLEIFSELEGYNMRWKERPLPGGLRALDPDGFISVQTNDSVGGLQIEASDRTLANEVAWPAVSLAGKIYQLDVEPVRSTNGWFNPNALPNNAFKLTVHTPWIDDAGNQIAAIGLTLKEMLLRYRSLRNYAKAL